MILPAFQPARPGVMPKALKELGPVGKYLAGKDRKRKWATNQKQPGGAGELGPSWLATPTEHPPEPEE